MTKAEAIGDCSTENKPNKSLTIPDASDDFIPRFDQLLIQPELGDGIHQFAKFFNRERVDLLVSPDGKVPSQSEMSHQML
ncbi:MAG: hypothetical protein JWM57_2673 [Phycisphaerales bacterium]|nr:hypothetical protein [Phycisphaerales bacterium]